MNLVDICTDPYILRVLYILRTVISIVCILVPIIIMITFIMTAFSAVTSGKDDDLKNLLPASSKKIITGLVVFLLPTIINFCVGLVGDTSYEVYLCESNLNLDTIKYYEALVPVEQKIQNLENNPTQINLQKAEEAVQGVSTYANEDTMMDYRQRITAAKSKVDAYDKIVECREKACTWKEGYCRIPSKVERPTTGTSGNGNSNDGDYTSSGGSGIISESTLLNGNYMVIEPPVCVKNILATKCIT